MNCQVFIFISITDTTPPDRVVCEHPEGHSGWHRGTVRDGRQYEWTTSEACVRGHFLPQNCTCQFCVAGQPHPAVDPHILYELVGDQYACGECSHRIPVEEVTPA